MMEDILERIQQRLDALNISARAASLSAGLSPDGIRNLDRSAKAGKAGITAATLLQLAPALEATAGWLIDGTGPNPDDKIAVIAGEIATLLAKMDNHKRQQLLELARTFGQSAAA